MPIKIPRDLPAFKVLSDENIFVMNNERAGKQDIRPLKIAILNLMPKKIQTENQLLRYLSNTPLLKLRYYKRKVINQLIHHLNIWISFIVFLMM